MRSEIMILKSEYKKLKSGAATFSVVDPDKHALVYQTIIVQKKDGNDRPYQAL